jgi:hypothetical protein
MSEGKPNFGQYDADFAHIGFKGGFLKVSVECDQNPFFVSDHSRPEFTQLLFPERYRKGSPALKEATLCVNNL